MFGIGPEELIVILVIALIVFGPKRLPEIGRTLGRSLQEFRKASNEIREHLQVDLADQPAAEQPAEDPQAHTTLPGAEATPAPSDLPSVHQEGSPATASPTEPGTSGPAAAS